MIDMVQRTYKYRIYPNKAQRQQLAIEFGHARFVWNWALNMRSLAFKRRGESLNNVSISRLLTVLKKSRRYQWLKQATAGCHTQKLRDMDRAFTNFFQGRAKYPRFKKKTGVQSVRYQLDQRVIMNNYRAGELLRITKLDELKVKWSRIPSGIPKMATISMNQAGQYHVCLSVEEPVKPIIEPVNQSVGIDVGVVDVLIASDGYKSGAPKLTNKYAHQLASAMRKLSKCTKGSNRRNRQRIKVARIQNKIRNSRHDFLHKESTRLIHENQVIAIETLNIQGMVKNNRLSKSILDASWGELKRQLVYKADWHGRTVHQIDQWTPTSKTCSDCGHKFDEMNLSVRHWICPKCDSAHDRDVNAAINILNTVGSTGIDARGDQLNRGQ